MIATKKNKNFLFFSKNKAKIATCFCFVFFASSIFAQSLKSSAISYYEAGNLEFSIDVAKEEIENDSKAIDSYVVLCWALLDSGRYREAEYWAIEARRIAKYDHRIVEVLGEIYYFLGQNDTSLSYFQEYISLVSNAGNRVPKAYYYMGEIYIREARFYHADISLTFAVRFNPLNDDWWARLGYAREMAKKYNEAAEAYNKALQINKTHVDAIKGNERIARYLR